MVCHPANLKKMTCNGFINVGDELAIDHFKKWSSKEAKIEC